MGKKRVLLVFQKNTVKGKVKSRLAASIGDDRALEVYQSLLTYTYREVAKLEKIDVIPFFSDKIEALPMDLPNSPLCHIQQGADLGAKMAQAFSWAFSEGYQQVAIIGTDCPEIKHSDIQEGLAMLSRFDVAIGPALDGGYYFLAMNQFFPWIFEKITWSSPLVLEETLALVKINNRKAGLLRVLRDIDTEADYLAFLSKSQI